jgi:hypothetical protein
MTELELMSKIKGYDVTIVPSYMRKADEAIDYSLPMTSDCEDLEIMGGEIV